jgi:alpha-tubulin suppressor-like RCC1 family protein
LVTTGGGGTNWKQVASGHGIHAAAIKTDGTLWTWGYNDYGQLGDNTYVGKLSPVTVAGGGINWKQVAGGNYHTAAIKTDGTLWAWGYNLQGQIGDNTTVSKSSPVTTVGGGTNWKQVACGDDHTAALKTDGTLWVWGDNNYQQLGDGTAGSVDKSSPVTTAGGGTNWKQVSCGSRYTIALKTNGTLWGWGFNPDGGVNTGSPTSLGVNFGSNWKQVACGNSHTAAIKTDGTLWTWGNNASGQLGDGTQISRSTSPVTTLGGGTNWKQVVCGSQNTAAIKTDGSLWNWGSNNYGQLGSYQVSVFKSSPVTTVAVGNNWKQVSFVRQSIFAISEASGW